MFDSFLQFSGSSELKTSNSLAQLSGGSSSIQIIQSTEVVKSEREDLSMFFGIGMAINIVMITSFFIWAVKQWKKNDKK